MSSTNATSKVVCETVDGKQLLRQLVVEPLPTPNNTPPSNLPQLQSYGENILPFVPTDNKFKTKVLKERMEVELGEQRNLLIPYSKKFDTAVGGQPYNEKGLEGAWTRISDSLAW